MILFIKNLAFTLIVPGTVAVAIPLTAFRHGPVEWTWYMLSALPLMLAGACIYLWCLWHFARTGRGTPAPIDPPKFLVERGLYRFTRNPMYVGVLCVIGSWALLFQSVAIAIYLLAVAAAFQTVVLGYEEPYLRDTFGADYEAYCSRVPRWFL